MKQINGDFFDFYIKVENITLFGIKTNSEKTENESMGKSWWF